MQITAYDLVVYEQWYIGECYIYFIKEIARSYHVRVFLPRYQQINLEAISFYNSKDI